MRPRLFDERDIGTPAPTQSIAQLRDEFESAGAAANDDDTIKAVA